MPPDRKAALREAALAARRALPATERADASAAVVHRLLALPELRRAGSVLLHAATADEVDPGGLVALLSARGVRTLFPRVRGADLEVAAAQPTGLAAGFRGVREPTGPALDPTGVDIAVVPGVAFDLRGGRLGHGGGHYDRLLVTLRPDAVRVGIAFACQLVPAVPQEPHDAAVDVIITDRATHRIRAPRR